jgi:hypothetical protein
MDLSQSIDAQFHSGGRLSSALTADSSPAPDGDDHVCFSPTEKDMYGWDAAWEHQIRIAAAARDADEPRLDDGHTRRSGLLQRVFGVGASAQTGK